MTESTDPFHLNRFVEAQDRVYKTVVAELTAGQKRTHWMWFIFPQIDGLGHSPMAKRYAIKNIDEARSYLIHPVLGPRLVECAQRLLDLKGRSLWDIFGDPDDMKLVSCMTLFAQAAGPDSVFVRVLNRYGCAKQDLRTLQILKELDQAKKP